MKKIYTLLLLLIIGIPAMAQQMFVEKSNGTETIEFSMFEKITFSGTTVKITQTDGTESQAVMSDIARIHFSDYVADSDYVAVENIEVNDKSLFTYISSDEIAINCNAGDIVRIYDVIGSQLICTRLNSDNSIISITQLPKGIYIININDRSAKFVKR